MPFPVTPWCCPQFRGWAGVSRGADSLPISGWLKRLRMFPLPLRQNGVLGLACFLSGMIYVFKERPSADDRRDIIKDHERHRNREAAVCPGWVLPSAAACPPAETFRGPRGLRKGVVEDLERLYRLRRRGGARFARAWVRHILLDAQICREALDRDANMQDHMRTACVATAAATQGEQDRRAAGNPVEIQAPAPLKARD